MRLHIVPDEKIINRCINIFNTVFPNDNIFIVLINDNKKLPKYVKKNNNVYFQIYNTKQFWETIGNINSYQHIIIHFLKGDSIHFLNKINHPSIYWIAWGADIYSGLLEQRGYKLYAQENILWRIGKHKLPYFLWKLIYKEREKKKGKLILSAAKKVHYFVPDSMYDEYPLLLSYYPELSHLKYKDFFYYPIDEILGKELLHAQSIGNSIVIGNSSSPTGNHLSIISYLKLFSLNNRKIIVPLSYGNKNYAKLVEQEGINCFNNNFKAITDFMPLDKYNQLLLSANIFIYGNWRQEAVGNILIALYIGGKVFLDKRNPLLNFYKSLGIKLFALNELSNEHLNSRLPEKEIKNNRRILSQLYSQERLINLIRNNF